VNALSEELVATIWRDSAEHVQSFARGKPASKLKVAKKKHHTGTRIFFRPDADTFGAKLKFDSAEVRDRLEAKTYLHRGLHIIFEDEATGEKLDFNHEGGIADYLVRIAGERGKPPIHPNVFSMTKEEPRVEIAM